MRVFLFVISFPNERVRGIEPLSSAWKAEVMPIYDTRMYLIAVVGVLGIEPSLHPPKGCVLPVYYTPELFKAHKLYQQIFIASKVLLCLHIFVL